MSKPTPKPLIDVQPHLDKLDALNEYLQTKINGYGKTIWIDHSYLMASSFDVETFIQLWYSMGIMPMDSRPPIQATRELTFDEWYECRKNPTRLWDSTS